MPSMTPSERYQLDVAAGVITPDPAQERAVRHFQRLYDDLMRVPARPRSTLANALQRLVRAEQRADESRIKGLYL